MIRKLSNTAYLLGLLVLLGVSVPHGWLGPAILAMTLLVWHAAGDGVDYFGSRHVGWTDANPASSLAVDPVADLNAMIDEFVADQERGLALQREDGGSALRMWHIEEALALRARMRDAETGRSRPPGESGHT